jgi:hypothetical protein
MRSGACKWMIPPRGLNPTVVETTITMYPSRTLARLRKILRSVIRITAAGKMYPIPLPLDRTGEVANGTPLVVRVFGRTGSKSAGRNAKAMPEHSAHVRFIVESSFLSDFSDWAVGVLELLSGMGSTQICDVIAN